MERVWTDQFRGAETKLPHISRVTGEMVPTVMYFREDLSLICNAHVKSCALVALGDRRGILGACWSTRIAKSEFQKDYLKTQGGGQ